MAVLSFKFYCSRRRIGKETSNGLLLRCSEEEDNYECEDWERGRRLVSDHGMHNIMYDGYLSILFGGRPHKR